MPTDRLSLAEAIELVDRVGAKTIRSYDRAFMGSVVRHVLIGAARAGVRFETEADIEAWLTAHTGHAAMRVRDARDAREEAARR